ncbi:MAG TPA: TonB family protein, partial [Allosphingosinicella sp.]
AWEWMREGEGRDGTLRFSNGHEHRGIVARTVRLLVTGGSPINGVWMRLRAPAFLEDFARAATMEPSIEGRGLGSLSLRGTSAVVPRLRACAEASARRHPADRARLAPGGAPAGGSGAQIARPPIQRTGLITSEDYPAAALRAEHQGNVTVELAVNEDGLVTGCTVIASSGSSILDSSTCAIAQRRFRFTPAIDANGRPVAGTSTRTVAWRIPEPDPEPVPLK